MKIKLSDLSDIFPLSAIHFDAVFHGVSIDSRTISPNDIFIALHGKDFDGHNYINEAIDKGVKVKIYEKDHLHTLKLDFIN